MNGSPPVYSSEMRQKAKEMHAEGKTYAEIGRALNVSRQAVKHWIVYVPAPPKQKPVTVAVPLPTVPRDTRDIGAILMGDPLPGRSALDQRQRT